MWQRRCGERSTGECSLTCAAGRITLLQRGLPCGLLSLPRLMCNAVTIVGRRGETVQDKSIKPTRKRGVRPGPQTTLEDSPRDRQTDWGSMAMSSLLGSPHPHSVPSRGRLPVPTSEALACSWFGGTVILRDLPISPTTFFQRPFTSTLVRRGLMQHSATCAGHTTAQGEPISRYVPICNDMRDAHTCIHSG
jgi:hypothetical protein